MIVPPLESLFTVLFVAGKMKRNFVSGVVEVKYKQPKRRRNIKQIDR